MNNKWSVNIKKILVDTFSSLCFVSPQKSTPKIFSIDTHRHTQHILQVNHKHTQRTTIVLSLLDSLCILLLKIYNVQTHWNENKIYRNFLKSTICIDFYLFEVVDMILMENKRNELESVHEKRRINKKLVNNSKLSGQRPTQNDVCYTYMFFYTHFIVPYTLE